MGLLSGSTKSPSRPVQQIIYVPTPTQTTTAPTTSQPTEQETLELRAENVLKRSRSRLGTVLTGFRGVLSQNDLVSPRKTLLGE